MTIYVVIEHRLDEDSVILGVFNTESKAEECRKTHDKNDLGLPHMPIVEVQEFVVDQEYP